jgi:ATP-dependent DNA helicase RecQ
MSLNRNDEEIILAILRTYGIYETQTAFNLQLIAKKKHTEAQVLAVYRN